MAFMYESPNVQEASRNWENSSRRQDVLKQWTLAACVPCLLLYTLGYVHFYTTEPDGKGSIPEPDDDPVTDNTIYKSGLPRGMEDPDKAAQRHLMNVPPMSPLLVVVILGIFFFITWVYFGKKREPSPEGGRPMDPQMHFNPHANYQGSIPRLVDVQPGEYRCSQNSSWRSPHQNYNAPIFGGNSATRWDTGNRHGGLGLGGIYSSGGAGPSGGNPNNTFSSSGMMGGSKQYTPIPQAPPEGMFSKHWSPSQGHTYDITYKEFPEIIEMGIKLSELLENAVIRPLLQKLEESDRLWETELNNVGMKFVTHDPTGRSGDRRNNAVVSVFDRFLPRQFASNQTATEAWAQRQGLECYFVHPDFPPGDCRQYVIHRLKDWIRRGLRYGYRANEKDLQSGITDAHIVENLLVKMLDAHGDFSKKYLYTPSVASTVTSFFGAWGGLGTSSSVSLKSRKTGNNGDLLEYEVQTTDGVRTLKPGNTNIFEAFALFFLLKGRDKDSRSMQEFPAAITALSIPQVGRPW